jgi:hypothetical protein
MVGRNLRYEIDIMIIQALEEESVKIYRHSINNQCALQTFSIEKTFY